MEIKELSKLAKEIKFAYNELKEKKRENAWHAREYAEGLVGDASDLLKLILKHQKYPEKNGHNKIKHELADCLYSIIIIAQELNIDLEKEFLINIDYLKQKYHEQIQKNEKHK